MLGTKELFMKQYRIIRYLNIQEEQHKKTVIAYDENNQATAASVEYSVLKDICVTDKKDDYEKHLPKPWRKTESVTLRLR